MNHDGQRLTNERDWMQNKKSQETLYSSACVTFDGLREEVRLQRDKEYEEVRHSESPKLSGNWRWESMEAEPVWEVEQWCASAASWSQMEFAWNFSFHMIV